MTAHRPIRSIITGQRTVDGAGVRLTRIFSNNQVKEFDPFLLLDHFGSDNPDDYMAGFPWHPHRGIETVTYMLEGRVEHGDSMGNSGTIGPGDVQWMTAGNGIIHQEMPKSESARMYGFQLWVNLPAKSKMIDPRYRDVPAKTIPVTQLGPDASARVVCGNLGNAHGPVSDLVVQCVYADITLGPGAGIVLPLPEAYNVFSLVFEGSVQTDNQTLMPGQCALFGAGTSIAATAGGKGARFLLAGGMTLREPVAWGGPIVMNTEKELNTAFEEYQNGTFLKYKKKK
jgi:quercetin 2,3-dioxygenase